MLVAAPPSIACLAPLHLAGIQVVLPALDLGRVQRGGRRVGVHAHVAHAVHTRAVAGGAVSHRVVAPVLNMPGTSLLGADLCSQQTRAGHAAIPTQQRRGRRRRIQKTAKVATVEAIGM